jgi:tetratricopeptide (TPR) repeat protein
VVAALLGTAERGGLFRPILSVVLAGGRPTCRFATRGDLLLHAAVTFLLVRLLLALDLGPLPAALGGLLFAVHPVHVEAVAGLVGRAELLAAFWMLLALGLHDRAGARRGAIAWAAVLAFLAAGTKESAWALPFFAAALDMARGRSVRAARPAWAGYAIGIAAHLALRRHVLGGWLNAPGAPVTPFDNPLAALHGVDRVLGGLRVAGLDLVHLVFPITLAPDFSGPAVAVTGSLLDPRLWGGVLLLGAALAAALWGGRNLALPGRPAALVGAVWVLVSAGLVMNLVLTLGTVLADRVLYWPSAGWCLVLAAFAAFFLDPARDRGEKALRLAARDPRRPVHRPRSGVAFALLLVVLSAAYAVRAAAYLPAWHDDIALFEASVRAEPRAPRAWYNLGRSYQDEGRTDDAIRAFERAVDLSPDYEESWAQLATGYMQAGRWEEARAPLAQSLRLNPNDMVSLMNEGVLWLNTGRAADARARFREIARREPDRADAWHNSALPLSAQATPLGRRGGDGDRAASWRTAPPSTIWHGSSPRGSPMPSKRNRSRGARWRWTTRTRNGWIRSRRRSSGRGSARRRCGSKRMRCVSRMRPPIANSSVASARTRFRWSVERAAESTWCSDSPRRQPTLPHARPSGAPRRDHPRRLAVCDQRFPARPVEGNREPARLVVGLGWKRWAHASPRRGLAKPPEDRGADPDGPSPAGHGPPSLAGLERIVKVAADAARLPFADAAFDRWSAPIFEHVGSRGRCFVTSPVPAARGAVCPVFNPGAHRGGATSLR